MRITHNVFLVLLLLFHFACMLIMCMFVFVFVSNYVVVIILAKGVCLPVSFSCYLCYKSASEFRLSIDQLYLCRAQQTHALPPIQLDKPLQ